MEQKIFYMTLEVRKIVRKNIKTGVEEVVTVTNRNGLEICKQLELLNLNDAEYEYVECLV